MTLDMTMDWAEIVARQFEPHTVSHWETPGKLARAIDPRTVQTPALDLIDAECMRVVEESFDSTRDEGPRLIITMPPQEGKSQRLSRRFPLWLLLQNPELRIAIASYEANVARRWGRAIRDDILQNPHLGLRIRPGLSAQNEWGLVGHAGGVFTAGVGGSMTGRPVDVLIIDDPVKDREQADSETYRKRVWDWYTDTAKTRLAPGAPAILMMTRWHPEDLAGMLLKEESGWKLLSVPAQCEDPATDPLGRELGEFLESARGRTREQWQTLKDSNPARTWSALYQQSPTPAEGLIFQRPWIDNNRRLYAPSQHEFARIVVGVDPAASSKDKSDDTGIVVVALDVKGDAWVLDDRTLRGTPGEWGTAVWMAVLQWHASEIVVEDNQGGEMVEHVLATAWRNLPRNQHSLTIQPVVTRVHANQSKRIRAESTASLYEVGRVHHATEQSDNLAALERQMLTWTGGGKSPDRLDALVHALRALATPKTQQQARGTRTR